MSPVKTVEEYLAAQTPEMRTCLESIQSIIQEAAPEASQLLSYGIPTFRYESRMLCAFGAAKNHAGFYVMAESAMEAHKSELEPYSKAKATVRFPIDKLLPATLITEIVRTRMKENEASRK